jgi:hypothetical protein
MPGSALVANHPRNRTLLASVRSVPGAGSVLIERSPHMQITRAAFIVSAIGVLAAACGSQGTAANTTTTPPSCAEITAFAERITDVGIMYDYQPTDSPEDLASETDVAFAGLLTGEFSDGPDELDGGIAYALFEIDVTEVAVGTDTITVGEHVTVAVDYNPAAVDPDEFQQVAVAGIPVVVFANTTDDDRQFVAAIEGLMTACDGAEPIGMRGTLGAWADVASLDEVLSFARSDG